MYTVFINGNIYIEQETFCQAMAVSDGLIRATGSNQEVLRAAPADAAVVDLEGRTVIPGLNDSHLHLTMVVSSRMQADLRGATSIEEIISRCKNFLRDHPELCKAGLRGYGWNQDLFSGERREPTRQDLDRISTDIPIILERVCGHVSSVNTKMMELAGVFRPGVEYPGGSILTDADGLPNGVFTEHATHVFDGIIPGFTLDQYEPFLVKTAEAMVASGLTSVQANDARPSVGDAGAYIRMLGRLYEQGRIKLRYHHQLGFADVDAFRAYLEAKEPVYSDQYLTFGPVKLFKDGSLGGRTGYLRADYADDPGNTGVCVMDQETMLEYCRLADAHGMQVSVHAIGDKAIEETVAAFESVLHDGKNPLRHSLIHCQITDIPLLERIKQADIGIQYQPIFLNYDLHVVEDRVGRELASTSYAFRTAQQMGIHVSYGTDAPVEDFQPFDNLYSAVTRRDLNGYPAGGFCPQECVSVADAVDAYTIGGAYQQFMEDKKGRLKPGYYADFVVLDTDIFSCEPEAIRRTKPHMTVIGGEIVFRA